VFALAWHGIPDRRGTDRQCEPATCTEAAEAVLGLTDEE
jgi:hypothetical protein